MTFQPHIYRAFRGAPASGTGSRPSSRQRRHRHGSTSLSKAPSQLSRAFASCAEPRPWSSSQKKTWTGDVPPSKDSPSQHLFEARRSEWGPRPERRSVSRTPPPPAGASSWCSPTALPQCTEPS